MSPTSQRRAPSTKRPRFKWRLEEIGPESKRAPGLVSPQTIARAIERGIEHGDSFVLGALPFPAAEIQGVSGQLVHLSLSTVELLLKIHGKGPGKTWSGRIVAARNDRDRGETVKAEIRNLQWLSGRIPKNAPAPIRTGTLFQTDRHGRAEHHRRLPAYITKALPELTVCLFGNREQLASGLAAPRLMTRDDTDHVRRRVIELCLRAYEPESRRALPPPDLERGALRLRSGGRGRPDVYVASCPAVWDRIDAVTLAHRLTGFEWRHGNAILPLLPARPELLVEAFVNALGKERGRKVLTDYAAALHAGRHPEHRRLTKTALAAILDLETP